MIVTSGHVTALAVKTILLVQDSSARVQTLKKPALNIPVSTVSQYKLYSCESQTQFAA